jgi:hypothetical protein
MKEMRETIVRVQKAKAKGKKYTVIVRNNESGKERAIHFGALGYGQFRDSTPLRLYRDGDHGDASRRRSYFLRHSGTATKNSAMKKERAISNGLYTPKLLAHKYLW